MCLLTQHSKKATKSNWAMHLTTKQKGLPFFMLFVVIINCTNSTTIAYTSATINTLQQILQDYFRCESAGRQMNCSDEEVINALYTARALYTTIAVLSSLFPIIALFFGIDIKELKRACKQINAMFHSKCLCQQT